MVVVSKKSENQIICVLARSHKLVICKATNSYIRILTVFWRKMARVMTAEGSEDRGQDPLGTTAEQSLPMKSLFCTLGAFSLPVSFIFIPLPFLSSLTPDMKCNLGAITICTSLAEQHTSEKNIYKFPS